MLLLLSPAKTLDFESPLRAKVALTQPHFSAQASELMALLQQQTPAQLAALMKLSDELAALNVARYAQWQDKPSASAARQAVLAFAGDVYQGLDAATLSLDQLNWLQQHVCILSGLYGALRPLDGIQPHRLEMGTRLANSAGRNLYAFWGEAIARWLNAQLQNMSEPVVINLASQEYFKAVDRKVLSAPVVDCVFQDYKGGRYKVIAFYAKRARGLMARWAAQQQASKVAQLKAFDSDGYAFAPEESDTERLVFRRRAA